MIITKEDIKNNIKISLPVYYGDDLREKNKAITLNKYVLSGVEEIKIEDNLLLFMNGDREIIRTKAENIDSIVIVEEFGEYFVNQK
jgi:hypothetical protein